jgi:hypothetical protein
MHENLSAIQNVQRSDYESISLQRRKTTCGIKRLNELPNIQFFSILYQLHNSVARTANVFDGDRLHQLRRGVTPLPGGTLEKGLLHGDML